MTSIKRLKVTAFRIKTRYIVLFVLLLSSCATFNPGLINYNEEKGLYEYGSSPEDAIPLRNNENEIISESNYDTFIRELEVNDNKYQSTKTIENANSIKSIDYKIASFYSGAINAIHNNQFEEVPAKIDKLQSLYPDARYFSDCSFLDAFALEKMGRTSDAKKKYQDFLNYSSGKYTERFRGHRNSDPNDSIWMA